MTDVAATSKGPAPLRPAGLVQQEQVVFARMRDTQDRIADAITAFSGTMLFVYLHAAWFTAWVLVNRGVFGQAAIFDPFPFGLLTMIVSLEAIFLSTFVMVSQNRQAARENVRADIDFETNVRSEVWSMRIGRALGLDPTEVEHSVQDLIAQNRARLNGGQTGGQTGGHAGTQAGAQADAHAVEHGQ